MHLDPKGNFSREGGAVFPSERVPSVRFRWAGADRPLVAGDKRFSPGSFQAPPGCFWCLFSFPGDLLSPSSTGVVSVIAESASPLWDPAVWLPPTPLRVLRQK